MTLQRILVVIVFALSSTSLHASIISGQDLTPLLDPEAISASEAAALMVEGVRALEAGQADTAERAFEQARETYPKDPLPHLGLAKVALLKGNGGEAWRHILAAERVAPQSLEVLISKARFEVDPRRNPDRAESIYLKAIELAPAAVRTRVELGMLYLREMSRPKDAVTQFTEALDLNAQAATAYFGRGLAFADLGEFELAEADLRNAAEHASDDATPLQSLGRLYLAQADFAKAVSAFSKAIEINPSFTPLRMDLATAFARAGQTEKALDQLSALAEADPESPVPQAYSGSLLSSEGRFEEAAEQFSNALERAPSDPALLNDLAWNLAQAEVAPERALESAERAVQLSGGKPLFRDTLAMILRQQGNLSGAEQQLEQANRGEGLQIAEIQYNLGVVKMELGKKSEALDAFKRAAALKPSTDAYPDLAARIRALEEDEL